MKTSLEAIVQETDCLINMWYGDSKLRRMQVDKIQNMINIHKEEERIPLTGDLRLLWNFSGSLSLPESFRYQLRDLLVAQAEIER